MKSGAITSTVPDKNSKHGKFFYTLKLKGDPIPITEEAKKNVLIQSGKVDPSGKVIQAGSEVQQTDPIEKAIKLR